MTKTEKAKDARLRREYHTTLAEKEAVLFWQNNACGICGKSLSLKGQKLTLSLDHDHKSGLKRGCLCYMCNKLLAIARDNIDKLRAAVVYLEHPPFTAVFGKEQYTAPGRVGTKTRAKLLAAMARKINEGK
jgi:hypothetical protein